MTTLRLLTAADHPEIVAVYRDAVLSQAPRLYSPAQVRAWAELAANRASLRGELERGHGLVSPGAGGQGIEAFALLDPADRLSLLYCRGRSSGQGRGRALLRALEAQARQTGILRLRTEASFLSRPLFVREGWQIDGLETLPLAGVIFHRFLMSKALRS